MYLGLLEQVTTETSNSTSDKLTNIPLYTTETSQSTSNKLTNIPLYTTETSQSTSNKLTNIPLYRSETLQRTSDKLTNIPLFTTKTSKSTSDTLTNIPLYTSKTSKSTSEKLTNIPLYRTETSHSISDNLTNIPLYTTKTSNSTSDTLINNTNITLYITEAQYKFGRLGNHMFQYASLLGIARQQGRKLIVSTDFKLRRTFKLNHVITNETIKGFQEIKEIAFSAYDKKLISLPSKNFRIRGFLQSFKYFVSIEAELRHEFTFHDSIKAAASTILNSLSAKSNASMFVGVHVRRGDFVRHVSKRAGYITPETTYYIKAFDYINSTFPDRNITFVIVSDDIPWCKANLVGTNVITAPPASADVHMAVLASCEHVIISSGTYGWWGAWLAGGHVVYFTGYLPRNTSLGEKFFPEDYYPNSWIGISN